jgi:hypothetical protein
MAISQPVSFKVSFDVDQIGGNLVWRATDALDQRNLFVTLGKHAGSVHFEPLDQVFIEVAAFGRLGKFRESTILDCALLTMPHLGYDRWSPPSPFSNDAASLNIKDFSPTEMYEDPVQDLSIGIQRALLPLTVIQKSGRWDLSMLLTVQIVQETPEGKTVEVRVFAFDPESEVGTGADVN